MIYKTIHKPHHKWISERPSFPGSYCMYLLLNVFSSDTLRFTCFPPTRWLLSILTIPYLHLRLPSPPHLIPWALRLRQLLVHLRTLYIRRSASIRIDVLCGQIHDSDMITGHALEKVINGPAHHTLHHLYFTVNYGQVSIHLFDMSPPFDSISIAVLHICRSLGRLVPPS
jgi:lathosterol oxidase